MVKVKSPSKKPIHGFTDVSSTSVTITNPPPHWINGKISEIKTKTESIKSEEPEINVAEYECPNCKEKKQIVI